MWAGLLSHSLCVPWSFSVADLKWIDLPGPVNFPRLSLVIRIVLYEQVFV